MGTAGLGGLIARDARAARPVRPPPAVWPPKGKHAATSATQFVLLDKTVRFLPNAPEKELKPGESITPPVEKYPDNEVNMHNDGFHIAFIDNPKEPYWKPDKIKPADIPDSWYAPTNFFDGTIHYRVEVLEKPDDRTLTSLLSRVTTEIHEGTHNVWLGHGVVTFAASGLHHYEQPVKAFRPFIRNTKFRFDKPLYELQLIVADNRGIPVHKWVEQGKNPYEHSPDIKRYLPLKVRYTAIVVAQGAKLRAPAWW
jgi:hypothetical protein